MLLIQDNLSVAVGASRVHILLGRWTRTLPPPCDMNFQKTNTHTSAELMPGHILYCRPFSAEVCFVVLMLPWFGKRKLCMENTGEKETKEDKEGTERERGERGKKTEMERTAPMSTWDGGLCRVLQNPNCISLAWTSPESCSLQRGWIWIGGLALLPGLAIWEKPCKLWYSVTAGIS